MGYVAQFSYVGSEMSSKISDHMLPIVSTLIMQLSQYSKFSQELCSLSIIPWPLDGYKICLWGFSFILLLDYITIFVFKDQKSSILLLWIT